MAHNIINLLSESYIQKNKMSRFKYITTVSAITSLRTFLVKMFLSSNAIAVTQKMFMKWKFFHWVILCGKDSERAFSEAHLKETFPFT